MPSSATESSAPPALRADALQIVDLPVSAAAHRKMTESFGPLFPPGSKLWVRSHGSWAFVSPNPDDTMLFPDGHAKARQDRYTWAPHPTAKDVSIGTLVPE